MKMRIFISLLILLVSAYTFSQEVTPIPFVTEPGDIWFVLPDWNCINVNSDFIIEVHLNTGSQNLAAYSFNIQFSSMVLGINTQKGINGVEAGPDGFVTTTSPSDATLLVSGSDVNGTGPGTDLHLFSIHFTGYTTGTSIIAVRINEMSDSNGEIVGNPNSLDNAVPITACMVQGDANFNGNVDIIDALAVAQYYVGLNPSGFHPEFADPNCDDVIDILDALLIAQYYVGLDVRFCILGG